MFTSFKPLSSTNLCSKSVPDSFPECLKRSRPLLGPKVSHFLIRNKSSRIHNITKSMNSKSIWWICVRLWVPLLILILTWTRLVERGPCAHFPPWPPRGAHCFPPRPPRQSLSRCSAARSQSLAGRTPPPGAAQSDRSASSPRRWSYGEHGAQQCCGSYVFWASWILTRIH